jgi:hypothetical protein
MNDHIRNYLHISDTEWNMSSTQWDVLELVQKICNLHRQNNLYGTCTFILKTNLLICNISHSEMSETRECSIAIDFKLHFKIWYWGTFSWIRTDSHRADVNLFVRNVSAIKKNTEYIKCQFMSCHQKILWKYGKYKLQGTVTNGNDTHDEMNARLNLGCVLSFSWELLLKKQKIKMYNTVHSHLQFYMSQNLASNSKEQAPTENKVWRRILDLTGLERCTLWSTVTFQKCSSCHITKSLLH